MKGISNTRPRKADEGVRDRGCPSPHWPELLILLLLSLVASAARAAPPGASEYEVKGAMLLNFIKFIGWRAEAFPNTGAPLVIGILGDDPFGSFLDEAIKDKQVNGHPILLLRAASAAELASCHVVYVSRSKEPRLAETVQSILRLHALTVGEGQRFTKLGGTISFLLQENKIRFEINIDAAREAQITISSKLLKLATSVRGTAGNGQGS